MAVYIPYPVYNSWQDTWTTTNTWTVPWSYIAPYAQPVIDVTRAARARLNLSALSRPFSLEPLRPRLRPLVQMVVRSTSREHRLRPGMRRLARSWG